MDLLAFLIGSAVGSLTTLAGLLIGVKTGQSLVKQSPLLPLPPTPVATHHNPAPTTNPLPPSLRSPKPPAEAGTFVMAPDTRSRTERQEEAALGELLSDREAEL